MTKWKINYFFNPYSNSLELEYSVDIYLDILILRKILPNNVFIADLHRIEYEKVEN